MPPSLNERQRRFALEYAKSGNGTQAAREAGYSAHSAHVKASKLLKLAHVGDEIKRLRHDKELSAYQFLKNEQLEVARRLVLIAKEGKEGSAVMAAKEILKDVLVERQEVVTRGELLSKTPQDVFNELKLAVDALSPEEKTKIGELGNFNIPNEEMPSVHRENTLENPPPTEGQTIPIPTIKSEPAPPDPLHLVVHTPADASNILLTKKDADT